MSFYEFQKKDKQKIYIIKKKSAFVITIVKSMLLNVLYIFIVKEEFSNVV